MKRAKLIIKGLREPIFISEKDGMHARSLVEDSDIDNTQVVRIGNWSGPKSEIRYIFFENESDLDEIDKRYFTDSEMDKFREQISHYLLRKGDKEYEEYLKYFIERVKDQRCMYLPPAMKDAVTSLNECELSDEEMIKEAEKYVDDNLVGKLTKKGELEFLEKNRAIRIYSNGTYHVLVDSNKESPYTKLSLKLHEYSKINSALLSGRASDRKELDILSQTMSVPDFIKNDSTT